jgi:cell division protein FtsN
VERTATHDTEYVDIVLGYHHILLFSLVFGVLIFGTGYFVGYYRARSDRAALPATNPSANAPASASSPARGLPPVQLPAMLTDSQAPAAGDVVKDMEAVSTSTLAPAQNGAASPAAAAPATQAPASAAAAATETLKPEQATAPPPAPSNTKPATAPAAETPNSERQPANGKGSQPAAKPTPRAGVTPRNASGNIYLQVSSFSGQKDAEKLINDLAAEGFRALIDRQLVEGRHTVLVGPFPDFKSAADKAKVLKQRNREAFPIRR